MFDPRSSLLPAVLTAMVVAPLSAAPAPERDPKPDGPKPAADRPEVEVRFTDDGTMKLKLLDDTLELVTRHGTLKIAATDVRRVEFATRVPGDTADAIRRAVDKLGSSDFAVREAATAALRAQKERAYPALVKAAQTGDAETVKRAEELLRVLREKVAADRLEPREFDVVHTDDSKITGKLTGDALKVLTPQFGEQRLKLSDVRAARATTVAWGDEQQPAGPVFPAPQNLMQYQGQFGKEFNFMFGGPAVMPGMGMGRGAVWGTDVYTLDSDFLQAATHAGVLPAGGVGVVRVRVIQPPPAFNGTARNGVVTNPFGNFPAGAYEFVKK